jgi:hypothetical protein
MELLETVNEIRKENNFEGGDCFVVAAKLLMSGVLRATAIGVLRLCHGEVLGTGGEAKGKHYAHAWIEDSKFVYDYSNGNNSIVLKELYYAIGNIGTNVHRYTYRDMINMMQSTGHYGYWDLQLTNNKSNNLKSQSHGKENDLSENIQPR